MNRAKTGIRTRSSRPPIAAPVPTRRSNQEVFVITLGIILLVIGLVANVSILWSIGIALVVIGAVLFVLGRAGTKVGGRAHWY
ncbi:hypothetical protein EV193_11228 [Herbihabitans rhizosphaerae]|uniref:Uncharacterized protein n=1 Tax=Herbihabitans rhizosphaerae TaxID=1872711 RepID=A0A4Q7KDU7_9PSEU|nr:hypothetical protein EV193_11228 [Herbihabitans rhizosphaerae]